MNDDMNINQSVSIIFQEFFAPLFPFLMKVHAWGVITKKVTVILEGSGCAIKFCFSFFCKVARHDVTHHHIESERFHQIQPWH